MSLQTSNVPHPRWFQGHVLFRPTVGQQQSCSTCSTTLLNGDFKVTYDVNREKLCDLLVSLRLLAQGAGVRRGACERVLTCSFVFQVANNYFAHFFAPQNLTKLNKNVVFVIDISSSMEGQKVKQVNGSAKELAQQKFLDPHYSPHTGFASRVWVWDFSSWPEAG